MVNQQKGDSFQMYRRTVKNRLCAAGVEEAQADADVIFMHVLGFDKTRLLTYDHTLSPHEKEQIEACIRRRIKGEPVQYITGHCAFMDLDFCVNKATLIPRPETELLVEAVAERLPKDGHPTVWDLGCGSGCIGISLASLCPHGEVWAMDISDEALKTARENAVRCGVENRVHFLHHDMLEPIVSIPTPDCIVSNPPYIQRDVIAQLQREVRLFEPRCALDGGQDGLMFYRAVIRNAPLQKGGFLAFEIGYDQGDAVAQMMKDAAYQKIEIKKDYAGHDRIVIGCK